MRYGLIGGKLGHSFSKTLHSQLNNDEYELLELNADEVETWLERKDFEGINVTIPYKEIALKHCIADERAAQIGCVNTLVNRGGTIYGYNTDIDGFLYLIKSTGIDIAGKKAVILGNGGTAKTAAFGLRECKAAEIVVLSRNPEKNGPDGIKVVNYEDTGQYADARIIVNTTPVGMYPHMDEVPIELEIFEKPECVVDIIYNPIRTKLMEQAQKRGIKAVNGLPMLVVQAAEAERIWRQDDCNDKDDAQIKDIVNRLEKDRANIVLIGMPGCGKSSVGRALADKLGRELVDTDDLFTSAFGISPGSCISTEGERAMREKEREIARSIADKMGIIIATGGGLPTDEGSREALHHNGITVFIDRDTKELATEGRPLSVDVEKLYRERIDIYRQAADIIVRADASIEEVADKIIRKLSI